MEFEWEETLEIIYHDYIEWTFCMVKQLIESIFRTEVLV